MVDHAASRSHRLLEEDCRAGQVTPPSTLLIRKTSQVPKTTQAFNTALSCPPQLDSKILLLKT